MQAIEDPIMAAKAGAQVENIDAQGNCGATGTNDSHGGTTKNAPGAETSPPPYSSFCPKDRRMIACLASISAVFSTISSFIYFPAITALSQSLHVSIESINLTVTSYFVVAGIAPSVVGSMADQVGRRPTSLLVFTIYLGANIGLAAQDSYVALQALRCLQSAGASGTVAIAYGVISDIAPPAERGSYVGMLLGIANAAPSLGPVLGGLIAEKLSWRWIFWILAIASGFHLLILGVFFPETSRCLVGNGSDVPQSFLYHPAHHRFRTIPYHESRKATTDLPKFRFPNPFSCLVALFQRSNFIVILVGSLQSSLFNSIAGSLSSQVINTYSLSTLTAGLCYLCSGLGSAVSAYLAGKLLDHDYKLTIQKSTLSFNQTELEQGSFPIEGARIRSVFIVIVINSVFTCGYGWALACRTHISVPLIMLFFTGSSSAATFVVCGTLLTDLNPKNSSTVQASYNLVRCSTNAAGIAALQPLIDCVGVGWCFSIFAVTGVLCVLPLLILRVKGSDWRDDTTEKR